MHIQMWRNQTVHKKETKPIPIMKIYSSTSIENLEEIYFWLNIQYEIKKIKREFKKKKSFQSYLSIF